MQLREATCRGTGVAYAIGIRSNAHPSPGESWRGLCFLAAGFELNARKGLLEGEIMGQLVTILTVLVAFLAAFAPGTPLGDQLAAFLEGLG